MKEGYIFYAIPEDITSKEDMMWATTNFGFIQIPIWVFEHIAENGFFKQKDGQIIKFRFTDYKENL